MILDFSQRYFLLPHIPKTAGTSLRFHFHAHLASHSEFVHWSHRGRREARAQSLSPYDEADAGQRAQARVVFGHLVDRNTETHFLPRAPLRVLLFRSPRDWEISRYNHRMNNRLKRGLAVLPFAQWVSQEEPIHSQFDWLLRHYAGLPRARVMPQAERDRRALELLDSFHWLVPLEDFDALMQPLFDALGVPALRQRRNVSGADRGAHFQDTAVNRELLETLCARDAALFQTLRARAANQRGD